MTFAEAMGYTLAGLAIAFVVGLLLWLAVAALPLVLAFLTIAAVVWVLSSDATTEVLGAVILVGLAAAAIVFVAAIVTVERNAREDKRRAAAGEPSVAEERAARQASKDADWIRGVQAKQKQLRAKHGAPAKAADCRHCERRIKHMSAHSVCLQLHKPTEKTPGTYVRAGFCAGSGGAGRWRDYPLRDVLLS
ncbi:hypothetical protein [Blastococcus sp. SYSU DS0541]